MSKENDFQFIVTEELQKNLLLLDYKIDQRVQLGKLIKSRDSVLLDDFYEFSQIVNSELERVLRSEQMWSAFYIYKMKRSSNFSVPGSGKTSMVYGAFSYLSRYDKQEVNKIIMIGPKNSFTSWKDEFHNNFGEKRILKVLDIHEDANPKQNLLLNSHAYNLILINYESLSTYKDTLVEIIDERCLLIYDEVHRVKGIGGIYAGFAQEVASKAVNKVVLTGTPIPNSYLDIYNMFNILYTDEYQHYFNWNEFA